MSLVRVAMPFLVFLFLGCESTDINAYDESAVGPGETSSGDVTDYRITLRRSDP